MTEAEYIQALTSAHAMAALVKDINFTDALQWAESADGMGPVLDPSLWMAKRGSLTEDIEVLAAARAFQQATKGAQ